MDFQEIVKILEEEWREIGCYLLEPYNLEIGAGTLHPETVFKSLSAKPERFAYVQPSIRPADGCYGKNPNRLYRHHQFQVILKPSPENILDLYFGILKKLGISSDTHDLQLLEDDWENPSIGAWGLGWEVSCNGTEITQITYIQQIGGIDCKEVPIEITYGLERLALAIKPKCESIFELEYDSNKNFKRTYGDLFTEYEYAMSTAAKDLLPGDTIKELFDKYMELSAKIRDRGDAKTMQAAYHYCLKAIQCLNILDSLGAVDKTERKNLIAQTQSEVKKILAKRLETGDMQ